MTETPISLEVRPSQQLKPLSLKLCTKTLLLMPGGPVTEAKVQELRDLLADRFKKDWEKAVEYVNKSNDRFINKARGLLTFNGLILAALGNWYRETHQIPTSVVVGGVCAIASATILLVTHFLVNFGDLDEYRSAEREFSPYVVEIIVKAKCVVLAGILSLASMLIPLAAFLHTYFEQ